MKSLVQKFPNTYKYILALLLFASALFISVLLNKGAVKEYFPYTAVILLFLATWILFKTDKKSLKSIGLNFTSRNLAFLPLGILIGAGVFLIAKYIIALYFGETIEISSAINYKNIVYAFYTILPTVAVEEFLFRGYLFKKTIELSSVVKANIIFSILFASIHVFDSDVLNSLPMFIFLAITISVGHLLFATALLKSKSLLFPIGIHLGNNWATRHVLTSNNDGESFLYIVNKVNFDTWPSFITFIVLWNGFFLLVIYLIWKWNDFPFLNRQNKE